MYTMIDYFIDIIFLQLIIFLVHVEILMF